MIPSRNSPAIRRINKDIREITKNPVEGIGIASLDNNPMKYVINMRLMNGPYEGYCVQLLLTFTNDYPRKPPKILIYPGQAIDGQYHHHIFGDMSTDENGMNFKKFCFDLLDNDFMSTTDEKTGWNPSYSISSLLLQVQNFISDPDMGGHIPGKYQIDQLMHSMNNYSRTFYVDGENGKIPRVHTWKDPYPEMFFKIKNDDNNKNEIKEEKDKEKEKEELRMQQIKENLNCFMLKVNYIDDPDILLGYPIIQNIGQFGKRRIELYPIPELLTYEGFNSQNEDMQGFMAGLYFNNINLGAQFKSANNEYYNNWFPIYINKNHYEKNKTTILNNFSKIAIGSFYDFRPEHIFQVLPIILNSMIIGIFKGKTTLSSSFIRCYFQFILLFKKLCQEFENDYIEFLNKIFNKIRDNNYIINKEIIPDIGNFFILLIFSTIDTKTESMKHIYDALYEEYLVRQMYWMFHTEESKGIRKKLCQKKLKEECLKKFEEDPNCKMKALNKFNEDLHKLGIFDQVVDIICKDKVFLEHFFVGKDKVKGVVETRMNKSFKRLFNECSKEAKQRLSEIINQNLDFPSYFDKDLFDDLLNDNHKIEELLKDKDIQNKDEIVKHGFQGQKGNKLLIITFFAQKKIAEPGFLEELEKNYGVYLDVDNFIKEMNQKLNEINTYKDLYKFIGSDYGKDIPDYELIICAYEKAKEKKYIRDPTTFPNFIGNHINIRGFERYRNFRVNLGNYNEIDRGDRSINSSISDNRSRNRNRNRSRSLSRSRSSSISYSRNRNRRRERYDWRRENSRNNYRRY